MTGCLEGTRNLTKADGIEKPNYISQRHNFQICLKKLHIIEKKHKYLYIYSGKYRILRSFIAGFGRRGHDSQGSCLAKWPVFNAVRLRISDAGLEFQGNWSGLEVRPSAHINTAT